MSQSGENSDRFMEPRTVTFGFEMLKEAMPLPATISSGAIISNWRTAEYQAAVEERLPEDATEQQLHELDKGCHWAAHRSSCYGPYQTANSRDYRGDASELSREESEVLRLLGGDKFMQIHMAAPPAELIDYMLSGGNDPHAKPKLSEITVAVIKGQIPWEDRFAQAGVPQPDEYMRKIVAEEDRYLAKLQERYPNDPKNKALKLLQGVGSILKRIVR